MKIFVMAHASNWTTHLRLGTVKTQGTIGQKDWVSKAWANIHLPNAWHRKWFQRLKPCKGYWILDWRWAFCKENAIESWGPGCGPRDLSRTSMTKEIGGCSLGLQGCPNQ